LPKRKDEKFGKVFHGTKRESFPQPVKKKKTQRWTKFRHRIFRNILFFILGPVVWIKYRAKIKKYRDPQKRRQFLVLFNHQTAFDQFFVGMAFKGPVYYLASEDLSSKGWVSAVIRYLVAPIPIKKQTTDIKAIMNCIKVAKEGGTIALAPEGNRTFSGKTGYMSPAIASLAKKLKLSWLEPFVMPIGMIIAMIAAIVFFNVLPEDIAMLEWRG
jgi:1-acyl-sn-glycerol-3-phosphate acyltransferase